MRISAVAIAAVLGLTAISTPALAQTTAPANPERQVERAQRQLDRAQRQSDRAERRSERQKEDCAFLTRAFNGVYRGFREEERRSDNPDPALVTMFATMQTNILLMAQGLDCNMHPMVESAKRHLERYESAGRNGG